MAWKGSSETKPPRRAWQCKQIGVDDGMYSIYKDIYLDSREAHGWQPVKHCDPYMTDRMTFSNHTTEHYEPLRSMSAIHFEARRNLLNVRSNDK